MSRSPPNLRHLLLFAAFVTTLLNDTAVDLWLGLTSDPKGHFQWARPGLLSYTDWAPGEPLDNSGPHHNRTPVQEQSRAERCRRPGSGSLAALLF